MHAPDSGYGLWLLAAINAAFFIFFAWSFYKPLTRWDWRGFGMFSAFVVALFAEMYGFPLTLYVLGGWLSANYPQVDWLSHDAGHLLEMWFGWRANPHGRPRPVTQCEDGHRWSRFMPGCSVGHNEKGTLAAPASLPGSRGKRDRQIALARSAARPM